MGTYISTLMKEYAEAHPDSIPVKSSLNNLKGALHFEQQMKKSMMPKWEHYERARVGSMITARTRVLRKFNGGDKNES